jgi:hypothetical protein
MENQYIFWVIAAIALLAIIIFGVYKLYIIKKAEGPRLLELTTAFQNVFIVFSICFSGIWVVYTFDALNQKEDAELNYQEIKRKIRDVESSSISLEATVIPYVSPNNSDQTGLLIEVEIVNKGNVSLTFDLSMNPLKVYQIEAAEDEVGYTKLLEPLLYSKLAKIGKKSEKSVKFDTWVSLTQSTRTLSYFVTVDTNKLYYIAFVSPDLSIDSVVSDSDNPINPICAKTSRKAVEDGAKLNSESCKWFASKYVFVPPQEN